jgi:hypothetical protein
MDKRDGVTTSSKEQMRSSVCVQVQGEITPKGGKEKGAIMDHPWGLRRNDRTSCKKTSYLHCGDDDAKMTQLKGIKSKMTRGPTRRNGRPNQAELGPGQSVHPIHVSVRSPISWTWRCFNPMSVWAPPFRGDNAMYLRGRPQGREVGPGEN